MKVFELMQELAKAPAGADVYMNMESTLNTNLQSFGFDADGVYLTGGDPEVLDENGNTCGKLSEFMATEE